MYYNTTKTMQKLCIEDFPHRRRLIIYVGELIKQMYKHIKRTPRICDYWDGDCAICLMLQLCRLI